jgi:hypothetical protein
VDGVPSILEREYRGSKEVKRRQTYSETMKLWHAKKKLQQEKTL